MVSDDERPDKIPRRHALAAGLGGLAALGAAGSAQAGQQETTKAEKAEAVSGLALRRDPVTALALESPSMVFRVVTLGKDALVVTTTNNLPEGQYALSVKNGKLAVSEVVTDCWAKLPDCPARVQCKEFNLCTPIAKGSIGC
jgi:hypothetical protein